MEADGGVPGGGQKPSFGGWGGPKRKGKRLDANAILATLGSFSHFWGIFGHFWGIWQNLLPQPACRQPKSQKGKRQRQGVFLNMFFDPQSRVPRGTPPQYLCPINTPTHNPNTSLTLTHLPIQLLYYLQGYTFVPEFFTILGTELFIIVESKKGGSGKDRGNSFYRS